MLNLKSQILNPLFLISFRKFTFLFSKIITYQIRQSDQVLYSKFLNLRKHFIIFYKSFINFLTKIIFYLVFYLIDISYLEIFTKDFFQKS